jgi:hypothetical protein
MMEKFAPLLGHPMTRSGELSMYEQGRPLCVLPPSQTLLLSDPIISTVPTPDQSSPKLLITKRTHEHRETPGPGLIP